MKNPDQSTGIIERKLEENCKPFVKKLSENCKHIVSKRILSL